MNIVGGIVKRFRLRLFGREWFDFNITEISTMKEASQELWDEFGKLAEDIDNILVLDKVQKKKSKNAAANLQKVIL